VTERTAVYRLYDCENTLLYVGISGDYLYRWRQHSLCQPWWGEVERFDIEWLDTREDALLCEKYAMAVERPVHNLQSSPWRSTPRSGGGYDVFPKPPPAGDCKFTVRLDPVERARFVAAAHDSGSNAAELLRTFIAWFLREPGVELPDRPPRRLSGDDPQPK